MPSPCVFAIVTLLKQNISGNLDTDTDVSFQTCFAWHALKRPLVVHIELVSLSLPVVRNPLQSRLLPFWNAPVTAALMKWQNFSCDIIVCQQMSFSGGGATTDNGIQTGIVRGRLLCVECVWLAHQRPGRKKIIQCCIMLFWVRFVIVQTCQVPLGHDGDNKVPRDTYTHSWCTSAMMGVSHLAPIVIDFGWAKWLTYKSAKGTNKLIRLFCFIPKRCFLHQHSQSFEGCLNKRIKKKNSFLDRVCAFSGGLLHCADHQA